MKTIAEIADEYERMCLWRRACILDGMITDSAVAMYLMRGGRHG